jgi:methionyl-tRNA synthetase
MNITIEEFAKVEIKVGTVLFVEPAEGADKLLKIIFDFGPICHSELDSESFQKDSGSEAGMTEKEESQFDPAVMEELHAKYPGRNVRQVMSAIRLFFEDPQVLVGKQICVVTNLEQRKFRGYESQGMIMAVGDAATGITFIGPENPVEPGIKVH